MVLVQTQLSHENEDPALCENTEVKMSVSNVPPLKEDLNTMNTGSVRSTGDMTDSTASLSDDEQQTALATAKANLKALLAKHDRSAKHPEVEKAIEELSALNPTKDAAMSPFLEGSFVSLTRPEFPGRLKQEPGKEHLDQYTLGRMSFNIFQPGKLVCTVNSTQNDLILAPAKQEESDKENQNNDSSDGESRTYTYPLSTNIIIHTEKGDFPACLRMEALCSSDKQPKNRLGVTFVGGTLMPGEKVRSDPIQLDQWKEVFGGAYEKAEAERSYISSFMQYLFKWMFQLSTPTDEQALASESCSVSFEMKRCPHGYLDVMYLDEDLRITRGNRGTVVIVERKK
ncbi:PAP_fibrillin [Seminavis robusta]|uniref:PAP_fibrillin n=1 Tax=Seminavis robusta TaxID=568900 RepID=A0A9N8EFN7_9STRA|nr:PAP_fibrillin [Seminavis robusta]|eukprot:Sro1024_g232710.1 PAP_fibrillin (342) ;mRNA; f:33406-34431